MVDLRPHALLLLLAAAAAGGTAAAAAGECAPRFEACVAEYNATGGTLALVTPPSAAYDALQARNWQALASSRRPAAFAAPASPADLAAALRCASGAGVALSVRGGGHSFEGTSLLDGGVVLDMGKFDNVTVDAAARTAVVGAGQRLGEVYLRAAEAGGGGGPLMWPGGSCAGVGVTGFLLGGGYGLHSRAAGYGSAAVVAARAATAAGKLVEATADANPELLWALRGGGAGLAVVYEWTLALAPAPARVSYCEVSWPTAGALAAVLAAAAAWRPWELPPAFAAAELNAQPGATRLTLAQWNAATPAGVRAELEKAGLPKAESTECGTLGWLGWVARAAGDGLKPADLAAAATVKRQYGGPAGAAGGPYAFRNTAWMLDANGTGGPLNAAARAAIVDALVAAGGKGRGLLVRFLGGAAGAPDPGAANPHAPAAALARFRATIEPDRSNEAAQTAWSAAARDALEPHSSGRSFYNYLDCGSGAATGRDLLDVYFGASAPRLREVGAAWDPAGRLAAFCEQVSGAAGSCEGGGGGGGGGGGDGGGGGGGGPAPGAPPGSPPAPGSALAVAAAAWSALAAAAAALIVA